MRAALALLLACSACSSCGVEPQPESARTVAAFEVPLPAAAEREEFLALLRQEAESDGFHVDAANSDELQQLSRLTPMTIHATVWRGEDDEERVATIIDQEDHLGRAWIMFAKGEQPERVARFRERAMRRIRQRWPATLSLPIMPTGAIPNPYQLQRTGEGYKLRPEAAPDYQVSPDSPLIARD
ncbi:MAG TPA: hypothetical protein VNT79_15485 [Phycisphaerae bacterium]|nr:hypothetical protein [Phycisphaerae bacterium]